jgi:hypothetical protein
VDTTTQLYKVIDLANRNGYPDAADWIRNALEARQKESKRYEPVCWKCSTPITQVEVDGFEGAPTEKGRCDDAEKNTAQKGEGLEDA